MNDLQHKWQEEFDSVLACKEAMTKDSKLSYYFQSRQLPRLLNEIVQVHNPERVRLLLAATINKASWDGRYCRAVKEWAAKVEPFPQFPNNQGEPREFYEFCLNEHPYIVNDMTRLFMKMEKEQKINKAREVMR